MDLCSCIMNVLQLTCLFRVNISIICSSKCSTLSVLWEERRVRLWCSKNSAKMFRLERRACTLYTGNDDSAEPPCATRRPLGSVLAGNRWEVGSQRRSSAILRASWPSRAVLSTAWRDHLATATTSSNHSHLYRDCAAAATRGSRQLFQCRRRHIAKTDCAQSRGMYGGWKIPN